MTDAERLECSLTQRIACLNLIVTLVMACCLAAHTGEHKGRADVSVQVPLVPPSPKVEEKPQKKTSAESPTRKDGETSLKVVRLAPRLVYWKTVTAKVTAYCPCRRCCGRFADGKTSTGKSAWKIDGVATDPKVIPTGTFVDIPGVSRKVADDTGLAMRHSTKHGVYHIDLRFTYHWQARNWGDPWMKVKLYRRKK